MRQDVDPGVDRVADALRAVDVRVHLQIVFVGGLHDGFVGFEAHRIGFDNVDARLRELLGRCGRRFGSLGLDLKCRLGRITTRGWRYPWTAHPHSWTRDLSTIDSIADRDTFVQRPGKVDGRRDTRHQQLFRRGRHDALDAVLGDPRKPTRVVTVAEDHQMRVQIDEPRHHDAASSVDNRRVRRYGHLRGRGPRRRSCRSR